MCMIKKLILCLSLLSMSSCGVYFVSTGDLKAQHQEDLSPLGVWGFDEMVLAFADGSELSDAVCLHGGDSVALAQMHVVPHQQGVLMVMSDISFTEQNTLKTASGELVYGLEQESGRLFLLNLFGNVDATDTLPFATPCPVQDTSGTLAESSFHPFCMSPGSTVEDIVAWAHAQEDIERAELTPLPASDLPERCQ